MDLFVAFYEIDTLVKIHKKHLKWSEICLFRVKIEYWRTLDVASIHTCKFSLAIYIYGKLAVHNCAYRVIPNLTDQKDILKKYRPTSTFIIIKSVL